MAAGSVCCERDDRDTARRKARAARGAGADGGEKREEKEREKVTDATRLDSASAAGSGVQSAVHRGAGQLQVRSAGRAVGDTARLALARVN